MSISADSRVPLTLLSLFQENKIKTILDIKEPWYSFFYLDDVSQFKKIIANKVKQTLNYKKSMFSAKHIRSALLLKYNSLAVYKIFFLSKNSSFPPYLV